MKSIQKLLLTTLVITGLAAAGCVGGYVETGGGGYYHHDGWYDDGPWIGGGPRGFVGVDVHAGRGDFHGGGDHRR
jgi:hypothetical protein